MMTNVISRKNVFIALAVVAVAVKHGGLIDRTVKPR